jgi:multiple sugar transport system permease protein
MGMIGGVGSAGVAQTRRRLPTLSVAVSYMLAIVAACIVIYPIFWLLMTSLKANTEIYRAPLRIIPSRFQFDTYHEIFTSTPVLRYLANSLLYATGGSLVTIALTVLTAYGISRYTFRYKWLLLAALLAVQLVPNLVRVIPVYIMMTNLKLTDSWYGIVALYGAGGIAYGTWFLKGFVDAVPKELDEAAWIDGASRWRTIWQIVLPALVPGIAALFILQFIGHWNDYTLASVLMRSPQNLPLTVGTFRLIGPHEADFRLLASASLINITPVIVVFSLAQRFLIAGSAAGAVK